MIEEILQKNLEEVERVPYTDEEIAFAEKIAATYGGQKLELDAVLSRYEKSRKAMVEEVVTPYLRAPLNDFILPLMDVETAMAGSTDVGDVSWVCPTSQIVAATCAGGTPEHTWQMVAQGKSSIAHKGLLYAGKVLAAAAIDLLESPELVAAAKEEFKRKTGDDGYQPLLPPDVKPHVK